MVLQALAIMGVQELCHGNTTPLRTYEHSGHIVVGVGRFEPLTLWVSQLLCPLVGCHHLESHDRWQCRNRNNGEAVVDYKIDHSKCLPFFHYDIATQT